MKIFTSLPSKLSLNTLRFARSMVTSPAYKTKKTTLMLNWYANPYHTPIFVAKEKGWLQQEGIDVAV
jgi:ABC-type nitrate/sulfonate/bicarbonate transport system substrate-binding protein